MPSFFFERFRFPDIRILLPTSPHILGVAKLRARAARQSLSSPGAAPANRAERKTKRQGHDTTHRYDATAVEPRPCGGVRRPRRIRSDGHRRSSISREAHGAIRRDAKVVGDVLSGGL